MDGWEDVYFVRICGVSVYTCTKVETISTRIDDNGSSRIPHPHPPIQPRPTVLPLSPLRRQDSPRIPPTDRVGKAHPTAKHPPSSSLPQSVNKHKTARETCPSIPRSVLPLYRQDKLGREGSVRPLARIGPPPRRVEMLAYPAEPGGRGRP